MGIIPFKIPDQFPFFGADSPYGGAVKRKSTLGRLGFSTLPCFSPDVHEFKARAETKTLAITKDFISGKFSPDKPDNQKRSEERRVGKECRYRW